MNREEFIRVYAGNSWTAGAIYDLVMQKIDEAMGAPQPEKEPEKKWEPRVGEPVKIVAKRPDGHTDAGYEIGEVVVVANFSGAGWHYKHVVRTYLDTRAHTSFPLECLRPLTHEELLEDYRERNKDALNLSKNFKNEREKIEQLRKVLK